MNKSNIKGLTLLESLVSVGILGIMMLSLAQFSSNALTVSYKHTQQVLGVKESRSIVERIDQRLSNAEYILPSGRDINLCIKPSYDVGTNECITTNTNNAHAVLVPNISSSSLYNIVIFYTKPDSNNINNLYEFVSDTNITWNKNTSPISNFSNVSGNSNELASNVVNGELFYYLADVDSITDPLFGSGKSTITSNDALIKRVVWNISFNKNNITNTVTINGVAKNVPRFL